MSASKILFFLCLSFILGIFFESIIKIPQILIWGFFILGFISILFKNNKLIILGFCIFIFILGILRMQISEFNIANDKMAKFNGKSSVVFNGVVNDEPDVRGSYQKIEVKNGGSLILITTDKYPEYKYLDKLKVIGKLETPSVTDEFNYRDYLLKDGVYSIMGFPKISVVGYERENLFSYSYEKILLVKERLNESINKYFLPPQSLLLQGIILGNNKNMTQNLRDGLNVTGLRFLTAISGVHVVIISVILMAFLLALGLYMGQAFYFSIIFIWIYIIMTGCSASGIRAGIMGSIFLLAQKLGRQNTSSRVIVLAAALMLLQNPLILIYDVGFQLSFMASLGIIYFKPLSDIFLKFIFKDNFRKMIDIISITFTAQIFTLPIMIFNFKNISLVAPITNILILPIFPLILIFGFCFCILAILSNILGWIFFAPLWVLINYFLGVLEFFNKGWAVKEITNISYIWIFLSYGIIFSVTYFFHKKYYKKF